MSRRDVDKLQEEIEELFADLWQVPRFSGIRHGFRPNVDCFHTDEPHALTVVVELPGVDARSVQVIAGERMLIVAGERRRPKKPGRVYQQMEIEVGPFQRQVRLAEDVDPSRARASSPSPTRPRRPDASRSRCGVGPRHDRRGLR
jgi:HSP20 family protein